MSVDERMVHDIVQKVMANMQISGSVSGMHGVFKDMNDAINASIEAPEESLHHDLRSERTDHFPDP